MQVCLMNSGLNLLWVWCQTDKWTAENLLFLCGLQSPPPRVPLAMLSAGIERFAGRSFSSVMIKPLVRQRVANLRQD